MRVALVTAERVQAEARDRPNPAEAVDAELVSQVQGHIRDALRTMVAKGLDEIGRILLREFYGGSVEAYRAMNPRKHASMQALLKNCESLDFPVKRTVLGNALQLTVFSREVPPGAPFLALPQSHRIELLRLKTPERIHELAAVALEKKMSMRRIRDEVRKLRRKNRSPRGRKPIPPMVRALATALRALQEAPASHLRFNSEDLNALSGSQRERYRGLLDELSRRVQELLRIA